jgi:hypothetical protein
MLHVRNIRSSKETKMRKLRYLTALTLVGAMLTMFTGAAQAYANTVTYKGQGLLADGFGGYDLIQEICDGNLNGILENGADAEGPYLLFVLTATGAQNADITFNATAGNAGTYPMTKFGNGTFKYVSPWLSPSTLPGNVTATYDGKAKNAQLVVSHGCRPYTHGAWCSPGFWKNAEDPAWALIGKSKTDLFNQTVVPSFYQTATALLPPDGPTLITVLTTPGANTFGAADAPYGLNAYNATGAFLTDNIPGFDFDYNDFLLQDDSQTCPIDHHGNFKAGA